MVSAHTSLGRLREALRARLAEALPLRYKLLFLVLAPLLLVIPGILALSINWGSTLTAQYLLLKANTDLSVAADALRRTQQEHLDRLAQLANSQALRARVEAGDHPGGEALTQGLTREAGFDFAHLTDLDGRRLADGQPPPGTSPLWARAAAGLPAGGIEVYDRDALERASPRLVERLEAAPHPHPRPVRAMLLHAAYPVRGGDGRVLALLCGGVLLNRNFGLVDHIRDLVYRPGSLPAGGLGTVTVFLDGLPIATNLEQAPGVRALDTPASAEVRAQVLGRGERWSSRERLVDDWYIAAFEPITDVQGRRVGMLSTAFREAPFQRDYHQALALLVLVCLLTVGLGAWVAVAGARSIFRPIETLSAVVRATQDGQRVRVGAVTARDEIGALARRFDAMLDLLEERNLQIQHAAEELEHKVEQRTRELSSKNRQLEGAIRVLQETRRQLVTAEKFAALGKLSAGIAHEVNNPTAIIVGNLDLLVQELGAAAEPVRTELDLIYEQLDRISNLVRNLLQYARPAEQSSAAVSTDLGEVLARSEALSRHLARKTGVSVRVIHRATIPVPVNPNELQQVLMNLVINAIQTQSGGGSVELTTDDWDERGVVIGVRDRGPGIPAEQLDKVFDPFFTTKGQDGGTGLGLAISYGLVRRAGGHISVESTAREGSLFRVWLPREPQLGEPGEGWLELPG